MNATFAPGPAGDSEPPPDPHRPQYHFLPPGNWMNDPNGLIHWQGAYHLFYQYNPAGAIHGGIHWGHAISRDLVHWTRLPVALAPTPGSADADGCWSGCIVVDGGVPTMIYTGFAGGLQRPCLAVSQDDLVQWEKWPDNPIIPGPPPGLAVLGFRDHAVWREEDGWYQIIGSGIRDVGGAALLYRSADLRHWEYLHPLCQRPATEQAPVWTGAMWECPDFFPLGEKHLLTLSVMDATRPYYSAYLIGTYAGRRFTPERGARLDLGDLYFYAAQSMRDDSGRRLLWGWIQEARTVESQVAAGWAGVMSLPRVLTLAPDGGLAMAPAAELQGLREAHRALPAREIAGTPALMPDIRGAALELDVEILLRGAAQAGLRVRCAPDGAEETRIYYDAPTGRLVCNTSRSSQDPTVERQVFAGPLDLRPGEPLRLRVFLDHSVIEVFANDRACLTARIYPTRPDSLGVGLFAHGGAAQLRIGHAWQMAHIWR
jgi:beta-fructofuranosidase